MKNNKGFSLVELIVVIAIMAILAAVAVIGVSVYIPKAQQASDKQLVSDIEYAIHLARHDGTFTEEDSGYVILSVEGVVNAQDIKDNNPDLAEVLENAFGENWDTEMKLSYDGWAGMTSDQVFAEAYEKSSFKGNESALIEQLGTTTNLLSDALGLNPALVGNNSSFSNYLDGLKADGIDVSSNQAKSNAAVLYAADTISNLENTDAVDEAFANFYNPDHVSYGNVGDLTLALKTELGTFGAVAAIYAHGEAFGQYAANNGNSDLLNNFHTIDMSSVVNPEDALTQVGNNLDTMINAAKSEENYTITQGYISDAQYSKDVKAYLEAMKKIDANSDKFTDKLGNADCYTDGTAGALLEAAVSAGSLGVSCNDGEVAIWFSDITINNTLSGIQD